MDFSSNLAALIKTKGMTLQNLALDINARYDVRFNKGMLSKWQNGVEEPTIQNAVLLAEYFGVSLDKLIGIETPATQLPEKTEESKVLEKYQALCDNDKEEISAIIDLKLMRNISEQKADTETTSDYVIYRNAAHTKGGVDDPEAVKRDDELMLKMIREHESKNKKQ